jgi:hypothetical protein
MACTHDNRDGTNTKEPESKENDEEPCVNSYQHQRKFPVQSVVLKKSHVRTGKDA